MTLVDDAPHLAGSAPTEPVRPSPPRHRRRSGRFLRTLLVWPISRILVAMLALAGLAVLLYPNAACWFSARAEAQQVDAYVHAIASLSPAEVLDQLREAHRYNRALGNGALGDPFASGPDGQQTVTDEGAERYFHTLDAGPDGVMGVLSFPAIDAELPIFHGTAPDVLEKGLGHLYGSALPVGGPSTHSVIVGHSGLLNATLFTHLDQARKGDRFTITVLDQKLTYVVDQIRTVLPDQIDDLRVTEGQDLVTLVTCTPTGVNTYRLLVRGHRVPDDEAGPGSTVIAGERTVTFPVWGVWGGLSVMGVLVLTAPLAGPPRRRSRTSRARRTGRGPA
jgi:sortase A